MAKPVKNYEKASLRDKRRWISWAARHYGPNARKKPYIKNGKPTPHSLQALRWGVLPPQNQNDAAIIYRMAMRRKAKLDSLKKKKKNTTTTKKKRSSRSFFGPRFAEVTIQDDEIYPEGSTVTLAHESDEGKSDVNDDYVYFYVPDSMNFDTIRPGDIIELDEEFKVLDISTW